MTLDRTIHNPQHPPHPRQNQGTAGPPWQNPPHRWPCIAWYSTPGNPPGQTAWKSR